MDLTFISNILANSNVSNFISGTIGNIIGAFVGFVLAGLLQARFDEINRYRITKKFKESIDEELTDIAKSLEIYVNSKQVPYFKINIPSWEALICSGIILEFIGDPIYPKVVKVYSSIKRFNESLEYMNEEDLFKEVIEIKQQIQGVLNNN